MDQKHLPSHEPAGSDQVFVFPHHKAPVLPPDERHNNENWPSQRKHRGCYYKTMDAKDSRCTFSTRLDGCVILRDAYSRILYSLRNEILRKEYNV